MTSHDLHTLRTLDPAGGSVDVHGDRAQADLRRILATDPTLRTQPDRAGRRARRTRWARRVVLASGVAAAVASVAILLPSAFGGDQAFATWTGTPTAMSASERTKAAAACRDQQGSGSPEYRDALSSATTAIAERRGDWTLVTLAGPGGFSALCITDEGRPFFREYFGSIGSTPPADRPDRRGLSATVLGTGSLDGRYLSVVAGPAGSDVTGVRYASPSRGEVTATVAGGQFALWLPGTELESASRDGAALQVTYRDGTTATVTLLL
ncbi:hypothetical protein [Flindersiella endophytica]